VKSQDIAAELKGQGGSEGVAEDLNLGRRKKEQSMEVKEFSV